MIRMSRLEDLKDLRDILYESIEESPPTSRAPLANQYRLVLAEIAELEAKQAPPTENPLEKIKREREERLAKSG